ncbi:hypothetical protein EVA_04001 [gut metagenome]|uniref:Uncharacterized protein n=1 Tax=gut metagenome TaxID=749906 RepID=J9GKL5_9ZZZZ
MFCKLTINFFWNNPITLVCLQGNSGTFFVLKVTWKQLKVCR